MNEFLDSLDGLLISNQTNVRYLSGFIPVEEGHREAQLLITHDQTLLFTNSLYKEKAEVLARQYEYMRVIILTPDNPLPVALYTVCTEQKIRLLGFEEHAITVAEHKRLESTLSSVTLIPASGRIEAARMIKREVEIKYIKAAAKLTDECFSFILPLLVPGVTEKTIAWEIEAYIRTRGHKLAFAPIVAFNGNASQPHYSPSDLCHLTSPGLVLLDFGARVNGYCADMTRVVFTGTPKEEWKKGYEAVLAGQQKALDLLAKGVRSGAALDQAARSEISSRQFPEYQHSLGHSLGLDIHEAPRLSIHKDDILKPGMVITIEPGLYVEESFGIRIEDLVHITEKGPEILSTSPKTFTIVPA